MEKKQAAGVYRLQRVGCSACAAKIEKQLRATDGVEELTIDLSDKTLHIGYDAAVLTPEGIREAVRRAGYDMEL